VEGPDDMPAHVRTALTGTQLAIPVIDGRPALGTWQGIYVFEHRRTGGRLSCTCWASELRRPSRLPRLFSPPDNEALATLKFASTMIPSALF